MCEDSSEGIGFDVTIYAPKHLGLSWDKEMLKFPFTEMVRLSTGNVGFFFAKEQPSKVKGSLTSKNAGGNHTHPTFMINPQYHLRILPSRPATAKTRERTTLSIETNRDIPVQVLVCWSQGERVNE